MKTIIAIALALPTLCFSLEEKPWFGNLYEFHLTPKYAFSFFRKVNRSVPQEPGTQYAHVFGASSHVTFPETWNWEMEIEFADTTPVSTGYRSFALQGRKLLLDDVRGDPISLSAGVSYRDSSSRLRKAPSTPYHARTNFEAHIAMGKEYSRGRYWIFRSYAFFAAGQGTKGSPWLRGDLQFDFNDEDRHQYLLYLKSYFGLGSRETVFLDPFKGWFNIHHQSIDLGFGYRYFLDCEGVFRFDYRYRVYARSYPEGMHAFIFSFQIPFSIF